MKNYVFSLQKIRDYKQQMLNKEKNTLLGLRNEKTDLEKQKEHLFAELKLITEKYNQDMAHGTNAMNLKLFQYSKENIVREQNEIEKQMLFLDTYIERQRKVVMKLSQELTGYDKLEEKQFSVYNQKLAKETETLIEEFVSFKSASADI
jgi:flagellar FliJ protein